MAQSRDGLTKARQMFSEAGLRLPPIPRRFERAIRVIEPWCFATRSIDPMAMYDFDEYVREALTTRPRDYLAVSHAGHGVNSYAINYHLLDRPLAIFAQVGWGGVHDDAGEADRRVNDLFERLAKLVAAATLRKVVGCQDVVGASW